MSVGVYPSYKGSGVNWLGSVPSHWTLRRLGYYLGERREKVSDREFPALSVTKNGVVPQLDTAAKTDDGDNRKRVCNGDFVINSRSDRKGSSGLSSLDGSVSLINIILYPHKPIEMDFIGRLLRSPTFQEEFYRFGKGIVADLWSTNFSEMRNILLAVPPTSEQSAIVSFLDVETGKIDELVAEQERLIALLKEKRKAVISHSVTKGLIPNVPMKDSGLKWLGDVPAHWHVARIGHYAGVVNGSTPSRDDPKFWAPEAAIPWVSSGEVNQVVITEPSEFITVEAVSAAGLRVIPIGSVLVGLVGQGRTRGMAAILAIETTINQNVAAIIPRSNLNGEYTHFALYAAYDFLRDHGRGGNQAALNCEILAAFRMPVPPIFEQVLIVEFIKREISWQDALLIEAEHAITLLQEHRAALISAAVTGKIDVRNYVSVAQAEAA